MFSHERNISGEDIEHITWVKEVAIPIIEQMGYKVTVVKDQEDYLSLFNRIMKNSQIQERNGKVTPVTGISPTTTIKLSKV